MRISEVRIKRVLESPGKLKAWASITFDDEFVVHNLKILEGYHGIYVAMPSRRTSIGIFKDVAHPLKNEVRRLIQEEVLKAYNLEIQQNNSVKR
jgi:stage V sporulation protein G